MTVDTTLINDMAYLFTHIFGYPVLMICAAFLAGSFLYALSIVTIFVFRAAD